MSRDRECRCAGRGLVPVLLGALAVAALAPAAALAAPEEYQLNMPDGGNGGSSGSSGSSGGDSGSSAPVAPTTPTAPAPTTPTAPVAPTEDGTTEVDEAAPAPAATTPGGGDGGRGGGKSRPALVHAETAPLAALGPEPVTELGPVERDGGPPVLVIAIAILAALGCGLAVWRLRYLRELPTSSGTRSPRGAVAAR